MHYQTFIDPVIVRALGIQRLVGHERDSRSIFAEHREGIVEVIFTVEVRNVRRPQFFCFRALLDNPVRDFLEHRSAGTPVMQVLRASNRQLSIAVRTVGGSKQIPGVAILGDRRIVNELHVAINFNDLRRVCGSRVIARMGDRSERNNCYPKNQGTDGSLESHLSDLVNKNDPHTGVRNRDRLANVYHARIYAGLTSVFNPTFCGQDEEKETKENGARSDPPPALRTTTVRRQTCGEPLSLNSWVN